MRDGRVFGIGVQLVFDISCESQDITFHKDEYGNGSFDA